MHVLCKNDIGCAAGLFCVLGGQPVVILLSCKTVSCCQFWVLMLADFLSF